MPCYLQLWGNVSQAMRARGMRLAISIDDSKGLPFNDSATAWAYETDWFPMVPFADELINMGTYPGRWAANVSFPAAPYLKPYPCAAPPPGLPRRRGWQPAPGRWCGMEGQIKDMKALGVDPGSGQLQPGVWMDECVDGATTAQGGTQPALRDFLSYASAAGVRVITIWAMNDDCGSLCYPSSSYTCPWSLSSRRRCSHLCATLHISLVILYKTYRGA
jgi:hypothetical protein